MKQGPFRVWLTRIWMDNKDEHYDAGELPLPLEEYFRQYKWWLKREYKFHMKQGK